jgi:hypothetical protein
VWLAPTHTSPGETDGNCQVRSARKHHLAFVLGTRRTGEIVPVSMTARRHRMSIRQAAVIWILVFLIGLTGGEVLRQETLDSPTLSSTRRSAVPTVTQPAPVLTPVAAGGRSATARAAQTAPLVRCDPGSCSDSHHEEESRGDAGDSNRGHGKPTKDRGHGRGGGSDEG